MVASGNRDGIAASSDVVDTLSQSFTSAARVNTSAMRRRTFLGCTGEEMATEGR